MTVIRSFTDLNHLSNYFRQSLSHPCVDQLTADNIQSYTATYPITSINTETFQSLEVSPYYIYQGSKTAYRKNVHSYIPNVLYKRFYTTLKSTSNILEATGSYVILQNKPIEQATYDIINAQASIDNQKVLAQLLDNFSNVTLDNDYYVSYIISLEEKYALVIQENEDLKNQLYNTKISTWY
jgi:hypothetical protein